MSVTYTFHGLPEMADYCEQLAKRADVSSNSAMKTQRDRGLYKREAATWRSAADLIRNTVIDPTAPDKSLKSVQMGDNKERDADVAT